MNKSHINQEPTFFNRYIDKVPDVDLSEALNKYGPALYMAEVEKLKSLGDNVYAEGKWTIKQILQHLIDAERIFQYRALRFARRDNTVLPGFDEEAYGIEADVNKRSVDDLLEEWSLVRACGQKMFDSFTAEDMQSKGTSFNNSYVSVLSIGFVIAGHAIHHLDVIRERYW